MKRTVFLLVFILFLLTGLYVFWAKSEREPGEPPAREIVRGYTEAGQNTGRGNLLGVQPWVQPRDYASADFLFSKLDAYLEAANRKGWIVPQKTIVVFPEYIGSWLVAMGEKQSVFEAATIQEAMQTVVLSSPLRFWEAYRSAPDAVRDKVQYSIFTMKARSMAEAYSQIFSGLASKYHVTIVAGSILLPAPSVQNGRIQAGDGPLYNVSAVFRPNGTADPSLIRKVYPITDELPFVCPASPTDVPVFETPAGKLGVLVCADSWNSPVYQTLKQKGASIIAVPSYSAGDNIWAATWRGYSGTETLTDAKNDVGKITEGQAWLAHAMGGRAKPEAGISKGLNVFLRGKLWDLGSDGTTIILDDSTRTAPVINGPALTCLWL